MLWGAHGRYGEDTARGVEGGGELKRDAWVPAQAGGGPERRAALPSGGGQRKQRSRQDEGEKGLKCNFKMSRDPTVNQQ